MSPSFAFFPCWSSALKVDFPASVASTEREYLTAEVVLWSQRQLRNLSISSSMARWRSFFPAPESMFLILDSVAGFLSTGAVNGINGVDCEDEVTDRTIARDLCDVHSFGFVVQNVE